MSARSDRRFLVLAVGLFVLLLLTGCGRGENGESGVAATVNGEPIAVAELEARHDLDRMGLPGVANPSVRRLRDEYGDVLSELIVARLAGQELAKRGLAVTEAELAKAEAAVRADYPGDTFSTMLLEEHIDLAQWRAALRDRLTVEKFGREVLRPGLRVEVPEAADYYKSHIDVFTKPERTRFLLVRSKKADTARAALAAYRKAGSRDALAGLTGLTVQDVSLADHNLPGAWRKALSSLKPGEASAVLPDDAGSAFLVLLDRQGESVTDPAKAYATVEATLMAAKEERAFAAWFQKTLATASIRVNTVLTSAKADQAAPEGEAPQAAVVDQEAKGKPASPAASDAKPEAAETVVPAAPSAPETAAASPPAAPASADTTSRPVEAASADTTSPSPAQPAPEAPTAAASSETPPEPAVTATSAPAQPAEAPAATKPTPETSVAEAQTPAAAAKPDEASASGAPAEAPATPAPAAAAPATPAPTQGGEVEFAAIKASWILYTVDDGKEERVYLKPGKPLHIVFRQRLSVRLGTPSEVSYRYAGREVHVEVPKKESKVLEFP